MLTLGLSGNFSESTSDLVPYLQSHLYHDASACLVRDGVLVAAVEEERFNRIKKTTKFPINAIRFCLERGNVTVDDIDAVGYYFPENTIDMTLNNLYVQHRDVPARYSRDLIINCLKTELDWDLPSGKLHYSSHHLAHALSTYVRSGMDEALVVILDGAGESGSGSIYRGANGRLELLGSYPVQSSLGLFYLGITKYLGYDFGDEYKVMGLAPYGDPTRFREFFESIYAIKPNGDYEIVGNNLGLNVAGSAFFDRGMLPRRRGEAFTQEHKDVAAAAQWALEKIALHIVSYWAKSTGLQKLCFGGGVAHNSSLNGKIIQSGIFDQVFVHPASHDAGAAEGAALAVEYHEGNGLSGRFPQLRDAGLGPSVGSDGYIAERLAEWGLLVESEYCSDIVERTASLLAESAVIGWVQGSAEFGPRALGNRSILADPRPASNKDRINMMVKKREGYRPFAPVATPDAANIYFDLPDTDANYQFMSHVVNVRTEYRAELGAVTHVDGTARLQITDHVANHLFHKLVSKFGDITGTPVLLNTSFNNNAEPIVTTLDEAVACFLTTDLDYLVIGNHLVRRHPDWFSNMKFLTVELRPTTRLIQTATPSFSHEASIVHEIHQNFAGGATAKISPEISLLLAQANGIATLEKLGVQSDQFAELHQIWQQRYVTLCPPVEQ
ncbi:carbamoyltransferase [Pseudonocardiaceae bacterium YIM PH 21723]|nr:carbamoyltransferase [Pseudonocardiaceae bacterium YIM PH 21723]